VTGFLNDVFHWSHLQTGVKCKLTSKSMVKLLLEVFNIAANKQVISCAGEEP
jgi:hypothetical protein